MNYGVTPQGFVRKPYRVILEEMQQTARSGEFFGENVDLSDASWLGIMIKLMAETKAGQYELAEDVYYSNDIDAAEGAALERLVKLGFISKKGSVYASVYLEFSGDPNTPVPTGTQAETAQNIIFETVESGQTNESGELSVLARCRVYGSIGNVPAGSITKIKTPVPGITEVTNPETARNGRGVETDPELRERYNELPVATGSSTEAIMAAVDNIAGVIVSFGYENIKNYTDENGLPSKSFEIVADGGLDEDIGSAIFSKKPAGMESYGNQTVYLLDSKGNNHLVKFSRPIDVNIYVLFEIEQNDNWSDNNIALIKQNSIEYIGGVDDNQIDHEGVGIGGTILAWKLEAAQFEIRGMDSIVVKIGKEAGPTSSENLTSLTREKPRTSSAIIEVVFI